MAGTAVVRLPGLELGCGQQRCNHTPNCLPACLYQKHDLQLLSYKHVVCCCCDQPRRLEDALADFTAAIETDPSSALSFNSRALLLERLGQPAAALADHDAAVALDARDAGYIKSRGLCARTLGQYEAAAQDFTRWVGRRAGCRVAAHTHACRHLPTTHAVVCGPHPTSASTSSLSLGPACPARRCLRAGRAPSDQASRGPCSCE